MKEMEPRPIYPCGFKNCGGKIFKIVDNPEDVREVIVFCDHDGGVTLTRYLKHEYKEGKASRIINMRGRWEKYAINDPRKKK